MHTIQCECGRKLGFHGHQIGMKGKCPKCGKVIRLEVDTQAEGDQGAADELFDSVADDEIASEGRRRWRPSPVPAWLEPEEPARSKTDRKKKRRLRFLFGEKAATNAAIWCTVLFFVFLSAAVTLSMSEPSLWAWPASYLAVVGACWCPVSYIARKFPEHKKWIRIGGAVLAIVAVRFYYNAARYDIQWTSDDGEVHYHDTHNRSRRVVYRRVYSSDYKVWAEGALSESGKQHGKWTIFNADALGSSSFETDQWLWYGEEITEGEWELRRRM